MGRHGGVGDGYPMVQRGIVPDRAARGSGSRGRAITGTEDPGAMVGPLYQPKLPGPPLNGPTTFEVTQPP